MPGLGRPLRGTWRQDPELSGGGYLYDTGSHLLDGVLWSTRLTPGAVAASMHFVDEEARVDGSFVAVAPADVALE